MSEIDITLNLIDLVPRNNSVSIFKIDALDLRKRKSWDAYNMLVLFFLNKSID